MDEKNTQTGMTARAVILSIVLMIIFCTFSGFFGSMMHGYFQTGYASRPNGGLWSQNQPAWAPMGGMARDLAGYPTTWQYAICVIFLVILVQSVLPNNMKLRKQEMVFIFAAMIAGLMQSTTSGTIGYTVGWWQETSVRAGMEYHTDYVREAFPFFIPSTVTPDTYMEGGFPYDGAVLTAVFSQTGYLAVFGIMTMFFVLMFRKAWSDIEALPYPAVDAVSSLLDMPEKEGGLFKRKWMWYGLIIGILMTSYTYLSLIPGIPRETLMVMAGYDLTSALTNVLPYAIVTLYWIPDAIGFAMLVPQSFLESFLIFFVAIFIFPIPQIGYYAGLHPSPPYNSQVTITQRGWGSQGWQGISMGWEFIAYGAFITLIAIEIFKNRSAIFALTRSSEEDKKEAFPFKLNLIGFVVCLIIFLGIVVAWGAYLPVTLLLVVLNLTYNLALVRIEADTSGFGGAPMLPTKQTHTHSGNASTIIIGKWLMSPNGEGNLTPWAGSFDKRTFIATTTVGDPLEGGYGGNEGYNTGALMLLPMLKLGDIYNTKRRDIFIACALGFVGCILISQLLITYAVSIWGVGMRGVPGAAHGVNIGTVYGNNFQIITAAAPYSDPTNLGIVLANNRTPAAMLTSSAFPVSWVIGAVIMVVLYFVNSRYPRLRLNPIAFLAVTFLVGGWAHYGWFFFPSIIAYIVKVLAVKVGGPTSLQDKIIPLAIGLILAGGLSIAVDELHIIAVMWPPVSQPGFN